LTKRIDLRAANKKALENLIHGWFWFFRERCGLNIFMMMVMELPLRKSDKVWCKVSRKWELVAGKFVWGK
jgi:uncharacterized membrane protein YwaF